ncbi:MAG TPA: hypothetical protein VLV30_08375 [Methanomicrobiales archaeon]|nr:hypothetical protein [Methanomicrobiales archaeon]
MHGAIIDTISDPTFESLAARAARYPAVMRKGQLLRRTRGVPVIPVKGDPALRWLLLNTYETTRSLKGTG